MIRITILIRYIPVLIALISVLHASATVKRASVGGLWASGGTWSPSGSPSCGDTVIIDSNVLVDVTTTVDLTACGNPTIIVVRGTLKFKTGKKMYLASGSYVYVQAGGQLLKGSGGGSSNIIQIGGTTYWKAGDGNVTGSGGGTVIGTGAPPDISTLPVELISFIAIMFEDRAHLEWETASEINNDYFVIERLENMTDWVAIGQVTGNGTSNELHFYEYDDYDVDPYAVGYYRLKQVDFDGSVNVHEVAKAEALELKGHSYRLYHSESRIEVEFLDNHDETTEILLINSSGAVIQTESLERVARGERVVIDLSDQPHGWYVLGISGTDNFHFEKMIHVN